MSPLPHYNDMPTGRMARAIKERLTLAFPTDRFQVSRIPTQMTFAEYQKRFLQQSPFIGLSFDGIRVAPDCGRSLTCHYKWSLACILKASGNLDRRFEGDARDIGLDMFTDAAMAVIHGADIADIGTCLVTGVANRYTPDWGDMAAVMANVDFEVMTTLGYWDLKLDELPAWLGINGSWGVNGDGDGGKNADLG